MAALGPVKYITIHCAATPEGRPHSAKEVMQWDIKKFGQVSYHYVIELDGNTTKCLAETTKGAHVAKANTGNIGICYVGGMDKDNKLPKDTRTAAQKKSLRVLVTDMLSRYPDAEVRGHRDWPNVAKACPSFDVKKWLAEGMPI